MTAPAISFDATDDDYCFVAGRGRVRRWHKVARDAGLAPNFSDMVYERVVNAKHRGRQVHEAIELFLKRQPFDCTQIAEEAVPFVHAFLHYWQHERPIVTQVETPIYCAELDYCTTPDFRNAEYVYEIKTQSERSKLWGLQTAAQQLAAGVSRRAVIWLRPHLKTRCWQYADCYSPHDLDVVREACRGEYDGPAITAWKAIK